MSDSGGDGHSNGHVYARKSEVDRLDQRIDEESRIASKGLGEFIERWVKVERKINDLSYDFGLVRSDVNSMRLRVDNSADITVKLRGTVESRLGSLESSVARFGGSVDKLTSLLEQLLKRGG